MPVAATEIVGEARYDEGVTASPCYFFLRYRRGNEEKRNKSEYNCTVKMVNCNDGRQEKGFQLVNTTGRKRKYEKQSFFNDVIVYQRTSQIYGKSMLKEANSHERLTD